LMSASVGSKAESSVNVSAGAVVKNTTVSAFFWSSSSDTDIDANVAPPPEYGTALGIVIFPPIKSLAVYAVVAVAITAL
jgi:hypothetical protein